MYPRRSKNSLRSAWVNYTGRSDTYRSGDDGLHWRTSAEGVRAGTDLFRNRNTQFGIHFGHERGRSSHRAQGRIDADNTGGGFYAVRVFNNGFDLRCVTAFAGQKYNMDRVETRDNRVYRSSFNGRTSEVNLELGRRFGTRGLSLRPVFGVDYFANDLKAAQESVGTYAMGYGETHLTQVFLRTGSDLRYRRGNFTLNSGVYYSYDVRGKRPGSYVTNSGGAGRTLFSTPLGREVVSFNVGGAMQVTRGFSIFGGYNGEYITDVANSRVQNSGTIGCAFKW